MKKKIVSMLMCLAMTVGVLSGCGNASEPAEAQLDQQQSDQ